jgi:2'-phosphotransferase
LIRANQGHSIILESSSLLNPITIDSPDMPDVVLHGTFYGAWPAILDNGGMSKMGRNHMHFAAGVPGQDAGVISGMRADAQILIYIDIRRALDAGIPFWRSDNGVILTEGDAEGVLSMEFFTKVMDRKRDVVLWEDGSVVNDLPEELKGMSLPKGKGRKPR